MVNHLEKFGQFLRRNCSHIAAWARRAGLLLCLQQQLHSSGTAWETFNLGNRLRNKAKSEKGGEGGVRDWIGFRSSEQDVGSHPTQIGGLTKTPALGSDGDSIPTL